MRLTDNWIELAARFVIPVRSARALKSGVSENVLRRYAQEGVTVASATSEIVGFPPLRVEGLRDLIEALAERADGAGDPPDRNGPQAGGRS